MTRHEIKANTWTAVIVFGLATFWVALGALFWVYFMPIGLVSPDTPLKYSDGKVTGSFSGYKFKSCIRIHGSEIGYKVSSDDTISLAIPFRFAGAQSGNKLNSRPRGKNTFGEFIWITDTRPSQVMLVMKHVCRGVIVQSQFGPWDVEP